MNANLSLRRSLRTTRRRTTPPLAPLSLDVLLAVAIDACHATAIADALNSRHAHRVTENAVSCVLRVLEEDGLIDVCRCRAERPRPRTRCFALNALGQDVLGQEMQRLQSVLAMATESGSVTADAHVTTATKAKDMVAVAV